MSLLFDIFQGIVVLHWGIVTTFILVGAIGYLFYKPTKKGEEYKAVDMVLVTKASHGVKDVLFSTIKHNAELLWDYRVYIVIDEGAELTSEIESFIRQYKNIVLINVPKTFVCTAIAKGRAIEYFIRTCVKNDRWYTFIDDDNQITDRKFLREITWYSVHGYLVGNGMVRAREGRSKLAFVADSLRYFEDITILRFCTGLLKTPLNGFHGEILIAKGEILKEVGFDRKTVTEDFSFGCELIKRKVKVWQSETIVSVLSPHSISDFVKQRNRWYRGISGDILKASWKIKAFFGLRVVDWKISIIGSWVTFPIWFLFDLPLAISLFCTIGLAYYYIAYVAGAMRVKDPSILFAIPLFGIMETFAPHLHVKNRMDFNVIQK